MTLQIPHRPKAASSGPERYYELKDSPGQGHGLFAKVDIPAGTRIISEPALLAHPNEPGGWYMAGEIHLAFNKLSRPEQIQFLSLTRSSKITNDAFELLVRDYKKYDVDESFLRFRAMIASTCSINGFIHGVFLEAARLNHSCNPSCTQHYSKINHLHYITTHRDIKQGEQLTVAYLEVLDNTETRQRTLLEKYGFMCECQLCCSGERSRSDARRERLLRLKGDVHFVFWVYASAHRGPMVNGPYPASVIDSNGDVSLFAAMEEFESIIQVECPGYPEAGYMYGTAGRTAILLYSKKPSLRLMKAIVKWLTAAAGAAKVNFGEDGLGCKQDLQLANAWRERFIKEVRRLKAILKGQEKKRLATSTESTGGK